MKKGKHKTVSNLARIAELSGISVKQAWIARDTIVKMLRKAIIEREVIDIRGFGKFTHYRSKPTRVYDIANGGGCLHIPAKWCVRFLPYKDLDYLINPHEYQDANQQPGS